MNILMVLSNPFTNDARVYNESRSLVQDGHKVTVIAYDITKKAPLQQHWDGIDIVRIRPIAPQRYYLGTPKWNGFSPLSWQWQAYRQAIVLHEELPFNAIHCHDLDTLIVGIRLKQRLGITLIYDVHEIYYYMKIRMFPHFIANIFLWLEKRLITKVDRIITVSQVLKGYLSDITNKPISVIMNCKPLESLEYRAPDNNGRFTILYIGVLHKGRSIPMIINAVEKLDGIYCIIGGIGQPEYVSYIKERCDTLPNVDFVGTVPLDQVIPLTKNTDTIFCMFDPRDPNSAIGMPNKLFEAMVCGRPIICTKGTYSGKITEQEEIGLTVEYTENALKEALVQLRDNPALREKLGRNALRAAITKYNWRNQEGKLLELYESLDVRL